jgi:hypothetical protein
VRFTQKALQDTLYAILLDRAVPGDLLIRGLGAQNGSTVELIGAASAGLEWRNSEQGMVVRLPERGGDPVPAVSLRIRPRPTLSG